MEKMEYNRWTLMKAEGIEWVKEHGKTLLLSISVGLALLFLTFTLISKFRKNPHENYFLAQSHFENWKAAAAQDAALFGQLSSALQGHADLQEKFGAAIAQRLIALKETTLANSYALATLKRLRNETPYHTQYARTTLLIEQGNLQQALEETRKLKISMEKDSSLWEKMLSKGGPLLYAFALLRIASLEREKGTPASELLAWQELEKWAEKSGSEHYAFLNQAFSEGAVTLTDYISHRKEVLKKG